MSLMTLVKFGYSLVIITLLLMIWASLSRAREFHVEPGIKYPQCFFNSFCSCSKPIQDLGIVMCKSVPLFRVPPPINSSKVYMLHLEDNGLRDIEPYFFRSTGLYRLAIHKNPLEEIPDEAFVGLEWSLRELELHENGLIDVPTRALRGLQKLELLDLRGNEITDLHPSSWDGLRSSLQTLILADNSIMKLPPDAFSGLPNLFTLDLRGNHLSYIDPNVFRNGMSRLNKLILADNQFTLIPYKEISPLKQLRHLDLSKNRISQVPPNINLPGIQMSLDLLRLDFNIITYILPTSFRYFTVVNTTILDGNPISFIRENAFREAKIRVLSLRDCGLTEISPLAFSGLESSLYSLDLSINNLTGLPSTLFHNFDNLHYLNMHENQVRNPILSDSFGGTFQYTLFGLDLSGSKNGITSLQDLRRMRSLRTLSLSRLPRPTLVSDDFQEIGVGLDELRIVGASLDGIQAHAFRYLKTIKLLDLSENDISKVDRNAFLELGHGLTTLKMSSALADSVRELPHEAIKPLSQLTHLDFSNNRIVILPDTSFHFLTNLKRLELQDNLIEYFHKGTLQGDIHEVLESVVLSVNRLKRVTQHTFVDLIALKDLEMEDNLIERIDRRAFMNCNRLRRISLKGNKLRNITGEAFQNLPMLEILDLSYNDLNTFEFAMFDQVGTLTSLHVNASHNKIYRLTDTIAAAVGTFLRDPAIDFDEEYMSMQGFGIANHHSNVKILDLSYNNISYISRSFFSSAEISISHLYLSHNKLSNATKGVFGNMPHLQVLDLSYNHLFEIDFDVFASTKSLQIIYLSHNLLDDLPPEIFKSLQSLRVVDLGDNDIKVLPDNLFLENNIEKLDLSNNELSRIPTNCFSPSSASSLTALDLSGNSIPAVGATDLLQKFRALAWLDLSNNRLIRIDQGAFSSLPKLRWLDLSHNGPLPLGKNDKTFSGVEHSIVHLGLRNISLYSAPILPFPSLRYLDLSHNNLPLLQTETANNLTQLRYLDLSYNDLPSVPIVTHSLSKLRWLALSGNPIFSLTNTSLLGVAEKLEFLDISGLRLNTLEMGALSKMQALRSLIITAYSRLRDFNLPNLLAYNSALKDLWVQIEDDKTNMGIEMLGQLPCKLNNITFSGKALRSLGDNVLSGVHNKNLRFALRNTSISIIQRVLFLRADRVRNLTLDLRHNRITKVHNPSTAEWPGVPGKLFLQMIYLEDNPLTCDCELGWVEVWERKRRQYICTDEIEDSCMTTVDDFRAARCKNRHNHTLIDVLKNDIECGWNASSQPSPFLNLFYITALSIVVLLYL